MIRFFAMEEFREIPMEYNLQLRYAVSNYGRLISFTKDFKDGRLLKGSMVVGYRVLKYKVRDENNVVRHKHFFIYHWVAKFFVPKTSEDQVHILHLDRNRANDFHGNLKWATKEEQLAHHKSSPYVIEAKKNLIKHRIESDGTKLTVTQVMRLKKRLLDPKRKTRLKLIAAEYGVSLMTLHRIKSGENWGHIKV